MSRFRDRIPCGRRPTVPPDLSPTLPEEGRGWVTSPSTTEGASGPGGSSASHSGRYRGGRVEDGGRGGPGITSAGLEVERRSLNVTPLLDPAREDLLLREHSEESGGCRRMKSRGICGQSTPVEER